MADSDDEAANYEFRDEEENELIRDFIIMEVTPSTCTDGKFTSIDLDRIRTEHAVQLLVQALRSWNQEIKSLEFDFCPLDSQTPGRADVRPQGLNFWDPLFVQLENQKVDQSPVKYGNGVIPLFRDRLFQALQHNEYVQSLTIANFDLTNHSEGIISFIDAALHNAGWLLSTTRSLDLLSYGRRGASIHAVTYLGSWSADIVLMMMVAAVLLYKASCQSVLA